MSSLKQNRVEIVPLKSEHLTGEFQFKKGNTIRGLAVLEEGEVIGVAGLSYSIPFQLFSQVKSGYRKSDYRRVLVLVGKKLQDILEEIQAPVFAQAESGNDAAIRFLKWMGLKPANNKGLYVWHPRQDND